MNINEYRYQRAHKLNESKYDSSKWQFYKSKDTPSYSPFRKITPQYSPLKKSEQFTPITNKYSRTIFDLINNCIAGKNSIQELQNLCEEQKLAIKLWKQKCEEKDQKLIKQDILIRQLQQTIKMITDFPFEKKPTFLSQQPSFGQIETYNSKFIHFQSWKTTRQKLIDLTQTLKHLHEEQKKNFRKQFELSKADQKSKIGFKKVLNFTAEFDDRIQRVVHEKGDQQDGLMGKWKQSKIELVRIFDRNTNEKMHMLKWKAEILNIESHKHEHHKEENFEKIINLLS